MESRLETWMNAYENKHREHDTASTSTPSTTSTPPPPSLSIPPLPSFTPLELTERQSTWEYHLQLMSSHMDLPLRDMINAYLTQQHYDTSNVVCEILCDVDMNELVRHRMNFIAWLTFPNLTYQHSFTSSWITAWQPLIRYWLQQQMSHVDDDVDGDGIVLEDDEMDDDVPMVEESTTTSPSPSPSSTTKKKSTPKQATTKLHASTLAIFDIPLHTSLRTYLTSLPSIDFATSTYHMASTLSPTYCSNFTLDKHCYYSKNYIRWNYDEMIKPQFSIEWARVAQPLMRIWLSKQLKERKRQRENGDDKDEQPLLPSKKHNVDTPKSHDAINTKRTIKSISHDMDEDEKIDIHDDKKMKQEMSHVSLQTLRSYVTSYLHNNHMGINTLITKIFGHSQYSTKFPNWLRGSIEDDEIVTGVESWYLSKRHRSPPSTTTTLGTKSIQTPPTITRSTIPSTSTSTSTSTPTTTTTPSTPITTPTPSSSSSTSCSGCITLRPEVTRLRNETDRLISAMIVMQKQIMALQNERGHITSSS